MVQLLEPLIYPGGEIFIYSTRNSTTTTAKDNYVLKSGRISGISAQHWRIMLIASGGAAPLETLGRISGGGFLIF